MIVRGLFILLFLLAGVLGHDPWKQDETYSFGIIYHFYTTHSWLIPTNAGTPFMEKPPLYYWSAVLLCKLLSPLIALHDAARVTSVLYTLISLLFMQKAARLVHTQSQSQAIFLLLGTLGILRHCHDMFTDVSLLAGATIAMYGILLWTQQNASCKTAGLWLGVGNGMAFLSKGFFFPLVMGISSILLFLLLPRLRNQNTFKTLLISLVCAAPFLGIWEGLLYLDAPDLFYTWFWDNNIGRFLGFSVARLGADNKSFYMVYTVWWFAFPVFPLALYTLYFGKDKWHEASFITPAVVATTGFILLCSSASARALYFIPLIPAFTLLALPTLAALPASFGKYWHQIIMTLAFVLTLLIWLIWIHLHYPPAHWFLPYFLMQKIGEALPLDLVVSHSEWLAITASVFALCFLLLQYRQDKKQVAFSWFVAIATLWITTNTLLMPWIDHTKSYRPVLGEMQNVILQSPYSTACMNTMNLGESIAPMLEYFWQLKPPVPVTGITEANCPLLFTVIGKKSSKDVYPNWQLLWKGNRALDTKDEELRLYAKP